MLETLTTLVQPWADLYADSPWLSTGVLALHLLALFIGGGFAIAADRQLLRARRLRLPDQMAILRETEGLHGVIIGALVLTMASGAALFASDVGTFAASPVFWTKMGVLLLLVGNGLLLVRAERRLLDPAAGAQHESARAALLRSAGVSLVAWMTLVVLGVIVGNV